jgi:hypothetical protein
MKFVRICAVAALLCTAVLLAESGSALGAASSGSLLFSTQPHAAIVGQDITGAAINPSGPPVTVELLDANGNLMTNSDAPVTIALATNPAGATLGGTTTVDAVGGVASFSNLTLNKPGGQYSLVASSPGLTSATSSPFDESSAAAVCTQGQSCQTSVTTATSVFSITANPSSSGPNAATLSESVDVGTPLQCQGYTPQDPNWFSFLVSSANRTKLITYTVRPAVPEQELVGNTQFCLGSPSEFTTSSGTPAPAGTLPNRLSGFVGMVPFCNAISGGPCIDSRGTTPDPNSPTGFDILLKVVIPAGLTGDPWGRA